MSLCIIHHFQMVCIFIEGDEVEFEVEEGEKGLKAIDLKKL